MREEETKSPQRPDEKMIGATMNEVKESETGNFRESRFWGRADRESQFEQLVHEALARLERRR